MYVHRPALISLCLAAMASSGVHAVGFGRVVPTAVMGQPLNVQVPIRLEQSERMYAECVQASVTAGDTVLPPSLIRVSVQATANPAEWIVVVGTKGPVMEPVVEVEVSAGCERRFVRRFTALADPPLAGFAVVAGPDGAEASSMPVTPVHVDSHSLPVSRGRVANGPRRPGATAAPIATSHRRSVVKTAEPAAKVASASVPRDTQVARLLLDVGSGPHLKMDIEDPIFMPPGAAASGPSGALDGDIERLQALEKSLADLRREAQAYRTNESGLRSRLSEAETRSRLVPWLSGLLLLAAGVAGWLALRQRKGSEVNAGSGAEAGHGSGEGDNRWWGSSTAAEGPTGPAIASKVVPQGRGKAGDAKGREAAAPSHGIQASILELELPQHDGGAALVGDAPMPASDTYPLPIPQQTQPFPGPHVPSTEPAGFFASIVDGTVPTREVSVEELLDLEQQADFFIALGQEDAAVDLLMSHLRSTGGQSPLPYTKLLEIYQRQGDRSAYERIRARFNRRFNAYAPDWEQGPLHGRSLEDYPEVMARLQALWNSPINAMAVLEAMLFRNDERQELFDLPAYKDVLLLFSLARDLYQQQGVTNSDVDLLLPLGDDQAFPAIAGEPKPAPGGHEGYDLTAFSLDLPPGASEPSQH